MTYIGCRSNIIRIILKMLVRNCGIRDISEITGCSRDEVQKVLKTSQHHVLPEKNHYDTLEIDEIWTFVGSKTHLPVAFLVSVYRRPCQHTFQDTTHKRATKIFVALFDSEVK